MTNANPETPDRITAEQLAEMQAANVALNVAGEDFAVAEAAFLLAKANKDRVLARTARENRLHVGDLIKDDGAIVRKARESAPSDEVPTAGAVVET